MLRRGRLRLVVAAAALLVGAIAGCHRTAPVASDRDPAPPSVVRAARASMAADPEAAHRDLAALVAQHPDSWEAARGLQDAERLLLSSEAFVSRYEARVAAQPGDALAHYLWGRARIDVPDVAGPAFARAAALAPQSPWPVAALAHLHRSAGDLFLTVQTYKEGIGRMPRSALLRLLLGAQLIDLNLYVEAQRHLELARQLAPDSPAVATALGRVYAALSRPEEAQALLLESYAIDPRQGDCARELARLALKARRVEDAEAYDRAALELGQPRDEALTSAIRAAKVRQGR